MLQMIKKREKMNNSAMSNQSKPLSGGTNGQQIDGQQFMAQLSKLYSSKRTPTANAAMIAGGNSRDSQNSQGGTSGNQVAGRKT
jgi:phosphoheptose isomerase